MRIRHFGPLFALAEDARFLTPPDAAFHGVSMLPAISWVPDTAGHSRNLVRKGVQRRVANRWEIGTSSSFARMGLAGSARPARITDM